MIPILTLVFWLAQGAAQQTAGGSVEGTVFRTGTTDPIERVQVTLAGSVTPASAVTDKDGHFSFRNVAAGGYTIRFQRDGYLVPASVPTATPQVSVAQGEHVTGLTYYLTSGGIISGRILDPLGRPAVGADVSALRLVYQEGRPTISPVKAASTNDRGEYRMYWLEPGSYIVRAEKVLSIGPGRAYYPGTAIVAKSVRVRVSEGTESTKIDFSLQKDETVRISGTVTSIVSGLLNPPAIVAALASDQPLDALRARLAGEAAQAAAPQFFLSPVDPDEIYDGVSIGANALANPQDRAAGKFEIRNVRPGSYNLISVVTDRSSTPPRYFAGNTLVDIGLQDVSDVNLLIAPGRDLRGRIVYSGSLSPAAPLRVQLRPKGLLPVLPFAPALSAAVEADGTFTIPNVPRFQYFVSVTPLPKDAYIADLRQGSFSIFDVGTIVIGTRANDQFEVILDSQGATINGKVPAPTAQQLAAGAVVALIPDQRRQENLLLYKRTNVSKAGAFSFTGVAPGRYSLFAWESIPLGAELNGGFMDAFRDEASEITVGPGDTTAVELRLIPR